MSELNKMSVHALLEKVEKLDVQLSDERMRSRDLEIACHDERRLRETAERELDRVRSALSGLLDYAHRNECHHDETHRGGFIWTVCDSCGKTWADDEGGFKPYEHPDAITLAEAALASPAAEHEPEVVVDREGITFAFYDVSVSAQPAPATEPASPMTDYDKAVKAVIESGRASIAHVQRVLKIGYHHAAHLVEQMENACIVSAPNDKGHRSVLVQPAPVAEPTLRDHPDFEDYKRANDIIIARGSSCPCGFDGTGEPCPGPDGRLLCADASVAQSLRCDCIADILGGDHESDCRVAQSEKEDAK